MIIDNYLDYIQEGYILSDKTISVNLHEFENRRKNKLLIIGAAGSGKTTLGEKLAKKYNLKWISIDSLWWRLKQKYFKDSDLREKDIHNQVEKKVKEEVIKYLKSNERLIMEGVDLLDIYKEQPKYRRLILNQPMIILGLSSLRAGIRSGLRNEKRESEGGYALSLYWMIKFNIKKTEPKLKIIRKDVKRLPNVEIKVLKI